jgi:hypothetical protein
MSSKPITKRSAQKSKPKATVSKRHIPKSTKKQTCYKDSDCTDKLFHLAKKIPGKDPDKVRKDPYNNNTIYRKDYGKNTLHGWQKDHINPDGSDNIRNLQALQSSKNESLGNSKVKKDRHSKCNK